MADLKNEIAATVVPRPALVQTIKHITARWAEAETPVLKHAFPLLAEGRPVSVDRLAEAAGIGTALAAQAVATDRVTLDGDGHIVELFGVTLTPTSHHIRAKDGTLHACCALVAHVVPRLLGRKAEIKSRDPITDDIVELEIAPDGLRVYQPDTALASMIETDERTVVEDVSGCFCRHVRHFVSSDTADEFVLSDTRRYVVTLPGLDTAARAVYSAIWS